MKGRIFNLWMGFSCYILFSEDETISRATYKVVQIWPGQTVTCLHTDSPCHIWTTLYNVVVMHTSVLFSIFRQCVFEDVRNMFLCLNCIGLLFLTVSRWSLFRMKMFQMKVVEKIETHILCSIPFLRKSSRLWDNVEKCSGTRHAHALCMLDK
jgi:hypothetical protein